MSAKNSLNLASALLAVAALTTACGGGSGADTGASPSSTTPSVQRSAGAGVGLPGANGLVAAVDGSTMQVQGNSQQTAVSWTSSTAFTAEVAGKLSDVVVGGCVMVTSDQTTATSSPTAESAASTVAAGRVSIQPASTDGTCTGGFGRGADGAGRPSGMPSRAPSGMPSGMPSGGPSGMPGGGRGFGGAFGTVASVGTDSFTVESTRPMAPPGDNTASPTTSTGTGTATTVTVTVTSATAYTKQVDAKATAATVGSCVSAQGTKDDVGALTATTISVRQAVDGQCQGAGMGGGGPRG